ncbi:unnamed protein product [Phytomonas sp. EM1]|nr:unnamed protein product [Phytomonas sp. EM1]|eukprot:CCW65587.1 unnamed protein product [Phytomonas sp. isolate EM1]
MLGGKEILLLRHPPPGLIGEVKPQPRIAAIPLHLQLCAKSWKLDEVDDHRAARGRLRRCHPTLEPVFTPVWGFFLVVGGGRGRYRARITPPYQNMRAILQLRQHFQQRAEGGAAHQIHQHAIRRQEPGRRGRSFAGPMRFPKARQSLPRLLLGFLILV